MKRACIKIEKRRTPVLPGFGGEHFFNRELGKLRYHKLKDSEFDWSQACGRTNTRVDYSAHVEEVSRLRVLEPWAFSRQPFLIKHVTSLATNLLFCQQGETPMDAGIKTAVCTAYERLLKESHQALSEYNEHLEWDDELHNLQAKYDQAYRRLRDHARDCEFCQFVSRMQVHRAA